MYDRRLILRPEFEELTRKKGVEEEAICLMIAHDGQRRLSRAEYERVIEQRAQFDLFLDAVTAGHSRTYTAGFRDLQGGVHEATLSTFQVRALAELVLRRVPMRAPELRTLQTAAIQNPGRIVESGRRAVDVKLSRYSWRSFHTLTGDAIAEKRYVFRPPADLRFACLVSP
jgi:hypothetical protein